MEPSRALAKGWPSEWYLTRSIVPVSIDSSISYRVRKKVYGRSWATTDGGSAAIATATRESTATIRVRILPHLDDPGCHSYGALPGEASARAGAHQIGRVRVTFLGVEELPPWGRKRGHL